MLKRIPSLLPGMIVAAIMAAGAHFASEYISQFVIIDAMVIGIIAGIIWANTVSVAKPLVPGVDFSAKTLLEFSVILLGFRLDITQLADLGWITLLGILGYIVLIMLCAVPLGKLTNNSSKLSLLVAVGTAICGASAIAAMGPVVRAKQEDSALAVSGMNVTGAVALVVITALALVLPLSDLEYGVWSGMSLQAVPTTIAAAFMRGETTGELGTAVKMARVAMLMPVSLILGAIYSRSSAKGEVPRGVSIPPFILWFIAAAFLQTTGWLPQQISYWLGEASIWIMLAAMCALGLTVSFNAVKHKAVPSLVLGIILLLIANAFAYIWAMLTL